MARFEEIRRRLDDGEGHDTALASLHTLRTVVDAFKSERKYLLSREEDPFDKILASPPSFEDNAPSGNLIDPET